MSYPSSNPVSVFIAQQVDEVSAQKGFKIVHLNAHSLLAHWEEISTEFLTQHFEVVVITESWLHSLVSDSLISKEGYYLYRLDRQTLTQHGTVKQGGGVCIYIRNCFAGSKPDYEMFHLRLSKGYHNKINLIDLYRPPDGNYKACIDELERVCTEIKSRNDGNLAILGDFNIDLNDQSHAASKYLVDFCIRNNLSQLVQHSTRVSKNLCYRSYTTKFFRSLPNFFNKKENQSQ